MRKALILVLLVTLSGCSWFSGSSDNEPEPTTGTPVTWAISPIMLGESDAEADAVLGVDIVVFSLPDPMQWSAVLAPEGIARFVPATDDGTMQTNPSLELIGTGDLTVTLTGTTGAVHTYRIRVVNPPSGTVGGGTAGATAGGAVGGTTTSTPTEAFAATLIGLTEQQALDRLAANGHVARIAQRDDEAFMLTEDYSSQRVNLTVRDDRVTEVSIG